MRAVIVCSGRIEDYNKIKKYFKKNDFIIAADGGARHLRRMEIAPSILLGDFDSARSEDIQYYMNQEIEVFKFPVEKDMTDSELAIEKALESGASEIMFIGALGSRVDHSVANILLLKKLLDMGVKASIIDENNELYIVHSDFSLPRKEDYKLSLIPISDRVTGVCTEGLKYELNNATMVLGTTWGVSNEFEAETAYIKIGEGIMLVCLSKD